jgi:tetratricopeptide (TPR) repeat protein
VKIRHIARALIALAAGLPAAAIPPEGEAWRGLETPGFAITGNASETELRSVAHNLESLRLVLSRIGHGAPTATEPTRVIVFKDASSFDPYRQGMGKNVKNVAGFFTEWMGDRFIAMNVAAGDSPYPTVYHEYLHSLVRQQFGRVPLWFDEGIAGVYETFVVEGNKAIVGKASHGRLGFMADHPWRPIADVIFVDDKTGLHEHDDDATSTFYVESWLLVHDIFFGHPQRLKQLAVFLDQYARGVPHKEAFEKSFEGGIAGVEAEVHEYLRGRQPYITVTFDELSVKDEGTVREVPRLEALLALGRLATIVESGSGGEAEKLFESARAIAPEDPRIKAGLGLVAYRENREDDATKLLDAAADAGVEDASALTAAGRLALHRDDDARARDLASRALAIRPADADLLALFGLSFVGETGDAAQGIAALEKADLIDPGRGDVLSGLVALCAQSRDRAKAEAAAKRAEALKQPAVSEHVRESLARLDVMESEDAVRAKDYPKAVALLRAARDRTARDDLKGRIDDRILELEETMSKKKPAPKR